MLPQIAAIRKKRDLLLADLRELTTEQINLTVDGSNNNIIWNLGHMIVVQQGVCYKRAGLPMGIGDDFWHRFKSGSAPRGIIGSDEIVRIKQLLITTLYQLEADYEDKIFGNYTPWVTRNGIEVASIDDGIKFLSFHDVLHFGIIMALCRKATVEKSDLPPLGLR